MSPVVDAIMLTLFVVFMVYIFRGYHIQRLKQLEEEEGEQEHHNKASSDTPKHHTKQ